ncbi:tyrosine-type recombinase/integrase [Shimazuella kribbensis]|uniref:tyrosine-type recombinase/integrase n=1 Tax=Shimazuella kribbensis TaxID=139808 RepID=UPI000413B014
MGRDGTRFSPKTSKRETKRNMPLGVPSKIEQSISPHKLRHFLLTWLKKQGIDDALIQPYSGHASRQSLEVYSKLAIAEAQGEYERVILEFPV